MYLLLFIFQIVFAVQAMKTVGVFHMDLHPGNILLYKESSRFCVKLLDLGGAMCARDEKVEFKDGHRRYMPPEWLSGQELEMEPATVYSLGLVLYEMVCGAGTYPYPSGECLTATTNLRNMSRQCSHLVASCLEPVKNRRISLDNILEHSWLDAK